MRKVTVLLSGRSVISVVAITISRKFVILGQCLPDMGDRVCTRRKASSHSTNKGTDDHQANTRAGPREEEEEVWVVHHTRTNSITTTTTTTRHTL